MSAAGQTGRIPCRLGRNGAPNLRPRDLSFSPTAAFPSWPKSPTRSREGTNGSNLVSSSGESVSLPELLSRVENPGFRAAVCGWLGDRVGRDAQVL